MKIEFQEISQFSVEDQAPNGKIRQILCIIQLLGVSQLHQTLNWNNFIKTKRTDVVIGG